ncbi:MAG: MotA/TolQ/ExbB proton channel family protein [Verrucomicrobiales bacterium]
MNLSSYKTIPSLNWRRALFFSASLFLIFTSMAMAQEAGGEADENGETMFSLILKGGAVMIPLGIASVLALALSLERFISLKEERILPKKFIAGLGDAWKSDSTGEAAEDFCNSSSGSAGNIFKAGIKWRNEGHEAISKAIEDAGSREADKIKRSLRPLSVIAGVCPLLGLLGTVYGMIDAFQKTAQSGGAAKTADLANGIYQALVSTAAGLTIAIPVLLLFQWLSTRADRVIDHIDEAGTDFIIKHALKGAGTATS